ncbi:MAG TPA: LPD38 domain-containing protein [Solirubrobacterales bacterium]
MPAAAGIATRGRLIPTAAVAAGTGGGFAAQDERQRILDMPEDEIGQLPAYRELLATMTPAQARARLAEATASSAFRTTAPVSAADALTEVLPFTGAAQRALGSLVGTGRVARAATGAALGAVGEGAQEGAESAAQRLGANMATGEDRPLVEDSLANFTLGAIVGGGLGGAGGLLTSPETAAPQRTTDDTGSALPAQPVPIQTETTVIRPTDGPLSNAVATEVAAETGSGVVTPVAVTTSTAPASALEAADDQQQTFDREQQRESRRQSAAATAQPAANDDRTAGPLYISLSQRRDLRALGYDNAQIAQMRPAQAQQILLSAGADPAQFTAAPAAATTEESTDGIPQPETGTERGDGDGRQRPEPATAGRAAAQGATPEGSQEGTRQGQEGQEEGPQGAAVPPSGRRRADRVPVTPGQPAAAGAPATEITPNENLAPERMGGRARRKGAAAVSGDAGATQVAPGAGSVAAAAAPDLNDQRGAAPAGNAPGPAAGSGTVRQPARKRGRGAAAGADGGAAAGVVPAPGGLGAPAEPGRSAAVGGSVAAAGTEGLTNGERGSAGAAGAGAAGMAAGSGPGAAGAAGGAAEAGESGAGGQPARAPARRAGSVDGGEGAPAVAAGAAAGGVQGEALTEDEWNKATPAARGDAIRKVVAGGGMRAGLTNRVLFKNLQPGERAQLGPLLRGVSAPAGAPAAPAPSAGAGAGAAPPPARPSGAGRARAGRGAAGAGASSGASETSSLGDGDGAERTTETREEPAKNPEETGQVSGGKIDRHRRGGDTEAGRGAYTRGKEPGAEYRTALHDGLRRDTDAGVSVAGIARKLGQADKNALRRQYPGASLAESIRSWQANNTVAATHADPGQPAEPVTPAVVAEAVQKSAAKTPRTPKGARQLLLGKIDAALPGALDEAAPTPRKGEMQSAFQTRRDQHAQKAGYVTFEVPGDGKFKVLNTKESLERFRKQVEKSPGFAEKGSKPEGPKPARTTMSADERARVMAEAETVEDGAEQEHAPPERTKVSEEEYRRISAKKPMQRTTAELEAANAFLREREAKEKAERDRAEAEKKAAIDDTDGFADSLPPHQRQRVINALNQLVTMGGKTDTRKAHMRRAVDAGARVAQTPEGRALRYPDGRYILESALSKTALDYADHITPAAEPAKPDGLPIQTDEDRADLERRAAEQAPKIAALTDEQARAGLRVIGENKAADKRDPKDALAKQHPDDVDTALAAVGRETIIPANDTLLGKTPFGDDLYERADGFRYRMRDGRVQTGGILITEAEEQAERAEREKQASSPAGDTPKALFEAQDQMIERLREGAVTLDEYKAGWAALQGNRAAIVGHLATMKNKDLLEIAGPRYKGENKDALVRGAMMRLEDRYGLGRPLSYGVSFDGNNTRLSALAAQVEGTTEADLTAFAREVASYRQERAERIAGAQDPKTLEDFTNASRLVGGEANLPPAQRAQYDRLRADARREKREAEAKRNAVVRKVDTGDTGMTLVETKHTKRGHDLFVVRMDERVERDVYNQLNAAAKRLGGYYSAFRGAGAVPGFQFTSRDAAEKFMAVREGNVDASGRVQERQAAKAEARAETLADKAAALKAKGEASLGRERRSNTSRQAAQAASAEADARREIATAETMAKIGKAIESGDARMLAFVNARTQVDLLDSALRAAHWDSMRSQGVNWEKAKEMPISEDAIVDAKLPQFHLSRGDATVVARRLIATRGGKAIGTALAKEVDYGDEYGKAVQEAPHRFVQAKRRADGTGPSEFAFFSTKKAAQAAIDATRTEAEKRGLTEPQFVVVKMPGAGKTTSRGRDWAVAMSPELAIERKLWAPDYDKKITLNAASAEKIIDVLGVPSTGDGVVPYWWRDNLDKRRQWARMGIETNYEMREALREYLALRQAPSEEDRIRKMERALAGNKAVGVDFFPTPPAVVQRLVEQADIGPGMRVLEPSAGKGDIAEAVRDAAEGVTVDTVEASSTLRDLLEAKGFDVVGQDFLAYTPETGYDRIVMNPPFLNDNGAAHVKHAYRMLNPGGRLVAVMGNGQRGKAEFEEWLEQVGGLSEELPEGSFKSSFRPTGVATKVVVIDAGTGGGGAFSLPDTDQTQTPEFKRWFGDSKVVDAAGKPLVVYHGSPDARFVREDGVFKGINQRYGGEGEQAFWFAKDRATASSYADDRRAFDYQNAEAGVVSAYLRMENPLIVDGGGREWRDAQRRGKTSDVIEEARAGGHDGVIIENVRDDYTGFGKGSQKRATTTYVVFEPGQIKSATDNAGTFDPANPSILFSRPESVTVPAVQAQRAAAADGKAMWDAANAAYRENLQGKAVKNAAGQTIRFSKLGRGKVLANGHGDALRLGVAGQLRELAKNAVVYETVESREGGAAVRYSYAAVPVTVDGKTYAVRMVYKASPGSQGEPVFYTFTGYELADGTVPEGATIADLTAAFGGERAFSRPAPGASKAWVDTGTMDRAVRQVMGQWRGDIPTVRVVTLAEELPAEARAGKGWERAEGWYDGYSTVYIVANNVPNVQRGLQVLAHEALGHYGVEAVMGKADWTRTVGDVARLRRHPEKLSADMRGAMESTIRRYGNASAGVFAREYLAVLAERGVRSSLTARALTAVRRWLRSMGFPVQAWADAEIRQIVAAGARQVTQRGRGRQGDDRRGSAMSERASPFFSALVEAVEKAQGAPRSSNAAGWKGWLDGAQRRGEFKQAERDWLEVDGWLDRQEGPITREAIADYVRANQVRIEEAALGAPAGRDELMRKHNASVRQGEGGKWIASVDGKDLALDFYSERAAQDELETILVEMDGGESTTYHKYQLPGGQNYRELLLTIPPAPATLVPNLRAQQRADGNWEVVRRDGDLIKAFRTEEEANRYVQNNAMMGEVRAPEYRSSHWDQPNVLAHVRYNERTDADGKRVLFIEEIQSDWHQAGRKRGYSGSLPWVLHDPDTNTALSRHATRAEADAALDAALANGGHRRLTTRMEARTDSVPDAPLKGTDEWAMLAFKRMVRHAAENGFDRIAWTTGEQQAARYDLSKQIKQVQWTERDGTLMAFDHSMRRVIYEGRVTAEKLPDYIGKEVAEKLVNSSPDAQGERLIEGLDLKVGGEGMIGFYDNILPKAVGKWAKKLGGSVGTTMIRGRTDGDTTVRGGDHPFAIHQSIDVDYDGPVEVERRATGEKVEFPTREAGRRYIADQLAAASGGVKVHAMDLTDQMRDVAMAGMPMFSRPDVEFGIYDRRGKELGRAPTDKQAQRLASQLSKAGKRVARITPIAPLDVGIDRSDVSPSAAGYVLREDPLVGARFYELPAARAVVDAAQASGSVRELLEGVAAIPGVRADLAALASRLAPIAEKLGVKVESPDPKTSAGGVYNAVRNAIWVRQAAPTVIVHEALHGVTSAAMTSNQLIRNSPEVRRAVAEFNSMREVLISKAAEALAGGNLSPELRKMLENKTGPLSNSKELLAYGMTEAAFRDWLASIPAPANRGQARNAWQWFKNIVAKIVRATPGERTMLDALIESSGDLVDFADSSPGLVRIAQRATAMRLGGLDPSAFTTVMGKVNEATSRRNTPIPERFDAEQAAAAEKLVTFQRKEKLSSRAERIRDNAGKRLVQKVFDQFRPLRDLDATAFMQAHLSKATDGTLEAVFDYGIPTIREGAFDIGERTGGFRKVMSDLNGEHDQFLMWVIGHRADALAQQGRERLFTEQDIAAMRRLNQGAMRDGTDRRTAYAAALRELQRYNKAMLDIGEHAGVIDPEGRKVWESEFYIPFYRVMDDSDGVQGPGQMKGLLRQNVIKRLNGGTEPLGDPLENILANWSHMLSSSMKNMAAVAALEAAERINMAERVPAQQKGAVWAMKGGEKVWYTVDDPQVLEALESLSFNGFNNPVMRAAGKFKRVLTSTVTINPSFRIRNLARDVLSAMATADVGYNPVKNMVDGMRIQSVDSGHGIALLAGGGAIRFGVINDGNQASHAKRLIESGIPDQDILDTPTKMKDALRRAYDWWQEVGDKVETVNRAVVYDRAIAAGKSHLEASYEARDLMNFTSMGSSAVIRALSQVLPFFNARLQGLDRLGRGVKRNPTRFTAVTGALALASMSLFLLQHDDEDYKALPDYVRDGYWPIKVGGKFLYVPKPFEVGALATIVERATEFAIAGDDYQTKDFARTLLNIATEQLAMNPVPQIVRPVTEAAFNYDLYRQAPIDTMGQQNLLPQDRYTARTSAAAVAAGQLTGMSPQRLEHMVSGYLGWVGTQALNASDYLMRGAMDLPSSPQRDLTRVNNMFVIGDFVKEPATISNKYLTRFYETQKDLDRIYASASLARKTGDVARANELLSSPELAARPLYQQADKQITRINQQIRAITADTELSAAEKNRRLEVLTNRRNAIAARVDQAARAE